MHPYKRYAFALVPLVLAACSSTGNSGGSGETRAVSVTLLGYGSDPFQLVSDSHTSRVDLYSTETRNPSTKVQDDDVMIAMVEHLDELGFNDFARPGSAPADGGRAFSRAIQVDVEGTRAWWPLTAGAGQSEIRNFNTAIRDFLALYNLTAGYQSVQNELGGDFFDQKRPGSR